ncbi:MAG: PDDEXK nuclease domain-containing protein [Oscillospiraceae bacterium]|nr:PDDEXK nuclease domain-containing protein [Oscillospiraceae bacterium]
MSKNVKTHQTVVGQESFDFFESAANLIEKARRYIGRTANLTAVVTNYELGRMIVEEEQGGKARAEYGKGLLRELSAYLSRRVGKGFSETTLKNARKFYQIYNFSIRQALLAESGESDENEKGQAMLAKFDKTETPEKSQPLLTIFDISSGNKNHHVKINELYPFNLSWSHYLVLMRIKNDDERKFYEIEAYNQQWDYRYLRRQYHSSLYERLALSRDKDSVMKLATEGYTVEKPEDMLKNPLILEFAGLHEHHSYDEDDLEAAVINKLQEFLLELGKGFLFEARQKRFTFNEKHYKVDLVTYNRLLRCYVLIDFKKDALEHRDLGQMQMYVHYFDRHVKLENENPTIGILLCKEKDDTLVELTLPEGENIYASEYSLYIPDKSTLQSKLAEWIEEFESSVELKKLENDSSR